MDLVYSCKNGIEERNFWLKMRDAMNMAYE